MPAWTALQVITDIARQMGAGMAEFIEREVETVEDYNLYCHYVAGLIGLGLSKVNTAHALDCARNLPLSLLVCWIPDDSYQTPSLRVLALCHLHSSNVHGSVKIHPALA